MRERSTWSRQSVANTISRIAETPDDMNRENPQPAADAYETGGPSDFAEDVAPSNWKDDYDASGNTETDEIGLPAFRPETFKGASIDPDEVYAKAELATKVARLMLPGQSEKAIEDQGLALMDLPSDSLNQTFARLAAQQGDDEEKKEEEAEAKEEEAEAKEEQAQGQQEKQAASKFAEDDEESKEAEDEDKEESKGQSKEAKDEEESKEAKDEEESKEAEDGGQQGKQASLQQLAQQAIQAQQQGDSQGFQQAIAQMVQEAQQQQQPMAQQQQQMAQQQQQMAQQQQMGCMDSMGCRDSMGDDQLIDQMLQQEGPMDEYDIQMDAPIMDVGDQGYEQDATLQQIFASSPEALDAAKAAELQGTTPVAAPQSRTASTRTVGTRPTGGVSQLGGQSATGSKGADLSNLWASAPDVSDVFK